jgi:hypothetical protein
MRRMIMRKKCQKRIICHSKKYNILQNEKKIEKKIEIFTDDKNSNKQISEIEMIICASKWAQLLSAGMSSSPHTYTFKLEILEPYRLLCATEPAVVAYTGLDIKYIQNDSMSYLILPIVMEGGYFKAGLMQHRSVVNFHGNAKRETLDSISRCYKYSNYTKVLELLKFIKICQKSLQLALSRSEIPLFEITEKLHTPLKAKEYFDDYLDNVLPESQGYMEDMDIALLVDHMDSNLLVRVDSTRVQEDVEALNRKKQVIKRLEESQNCTRMLYHLMKGNVDDAREYQMKWKSLIMNNPGVQPVTGDMDVRPTGDTDTSSYEYSQWDQRTHNASYGSKAYETSLWVYINTC